MRTAIPQALSPPGPRQGSPPAISALPIPRALAAPARLSRPAAGSALGTSPRGRAQVLTVCRSGPRSGPGSSLPSARSGRRRLRARTSRAQTFRR